MSYELNINAGVTGVQQVENLGAATDKLTDRTKRVDDAIKAFASSNDKLAAKLLEVEKSELQLEKMREQHRMQTERLAAATDKQTASQERLNNAVKGHVSDVQAASAAIRTFEGNLPIRAVEQFATKMLGLGPLMQAAFPIVGAVAMLEVLDKGAEKLGIHLSFWGEIKEAQKASNEQLKTAAAEYDTLIEKLKTLQKQERRRALIARDPKGGAIQADVEEAAETTIEAQTRDRQAIQSLERQLAAVRRLSGPKGNHPTADEAFYAGLAGFPKTPLQNGLIPGSEISQQQSEAGAALIPGLEGALRAARLKLETDMAAAKAQGAKMDEEIEKRREESARKVKEIEERILEIRKKSVEIYQRSLNLDEGPLGKLFNKRENVGVSFTDDLRKYGSTAARRASLAGSARLEVGAVNNEITQALQTLAAHGVDLGLELDAAGQSALRNLIRTDLANERHDAPELQALLKPGIPAPPAGFRTGAQQLRDARDSERRYMSLSRVSGQLSGISEGDQIQSNYQARIRFANEELAAQLRIADAKRDQQARSDALDQAQQKRYDAALEREQALMEIALREKQQFQNAAVGFVRAARSGNVGGFLRGELEGMGDKIVSNLAGMAWGDVSKLIPHSSGTLGKILQGTAFGPDPMKSAGVTLTAAGVKLDMAAQKLLALSGSGGGGGRLGGGGGGLGSLPAGGGAVAGIAAGDDGYTSDGVQRYSPENYDADGNFLGAGATSSHDPSVGPISRTVGGSSAARGVGIAGAAVAGAYGAYSGFKTGGLRGTAEGVGALSGAAGSIVALAGVTGPAAPILAGIGIALGVFSSMLGDPKQLRAAQIQKTLQNNQYIDPVAIHASMTTGGGYADYDRFGGIRGSDLSPFPFIQPGYFDAQHNIIPGRTLNQFGGGPAQVVVHVQTLDSKSFNDNSHLVADAVQHALQTGRGTGLQETLRSM